jgi:Holliday junction resolvase-like predicted endonuclease
MKKIAAHGWGVAAEELVAEHYRTESCGTILERRLKTPVGEIDLIVLTEESLVFIEVSIAHYFAYVGLRDCQSHDL